MRAATAIYFTCADFQKRRFQSVLEKTSFLVKFSHSAYDLFSVIKPKTKAVHTTPSKVIYVATLGKLKLLDTKSPF